jgi:hypothetical protein
MKLDVQLNEITATIPPSFQFRPIDTCIADPTQLIIQRLNIAHLLCKSRCVLHRKYLVGSHDYPEYGYSVTAGIDAAMQLLDFQQQTYEAAQPGGKLARDRCFPSSLSMHDFLLAAMIIYMRTMKILEGEAKGTHLNPSYQKQKTDMISALKRSSEIWHISQIKYPEVKRAADVLAVMMRKIRAAAGLSRECSSMLSSTNLWDIDGGTENSSSIAGLSLEGMYCMMVKSKEDFNIAARYGQKLIHYLIDGFVMNHAVANPLGGVTWSMDPPTTYLNVNTEASLAQGSYDLNEPFDYLMDLPTNFEWVCVFLSLFSISFGGGDY